MGMAYRHAWELVDDLNRCFESPVVAASTGGRAGGGAEVTRLGEELIRRFHAMERAARRAIGRDLDALDAKLAAGARTPRAGKDRARKR
jgi:molybdate transport system regulatory protein